MAEKNIRIQYEIAFPNGRTQELLVELDPVTYLSQVPPRDNYPEWTALTCHQCKNCPLSPAQHPHCPIARHIVGVAEAFSKNISYEEVKVTIRTEARTYQREIALHNVLRSLVGLYMATSGCPIMDKLRPLAVLHLPFATCQETAYRALSIYALAQIFIHKRGGKPDWAFEDFGKFYQEVEIVNQGFHQRLVSAGLEDATLNAVGNLNCYAQFTQSLLEYGKLEKIEDWFSAYFEEGKKN
ncbi:MAG TPA: hypothetical protein PLL75_02950 [Candidatus Omnitrophota bacterium]|nr:hypothetical protein [Candidatus Omnitrophota bacterium]HPS36671.1 hypothetical protein [Candidatus Omnitrophota bacterium]